MADKIKGLTVKIGADTSDFIKELKKVDKEINQTQKTANELQKGLELKFNAQNFTVAQRKLQQALSETEEKAKAIRQQLKYLEDTGAVDTEGYEKLQTALAQAETQALKLNEQLKQLNNIKLDQISNSVKKVSDGLNSAAKATAAFSAAAAGIVAGMAKLATNAVKTGDEIQTLADKYNLSAEAIQKWNYIALQTDVSADYLYKAMTKVRDAIGTGMAGEANNATKAIESLGLSMEEVGTGEQGFYNIINALSSVKDATMQAYYANEIFGERLATELIPMLNKGEGALDSLANEFQQIGYLTNEQIRTLSDYDNKLNDIKTRWDNLKTEVGLSMLDMLDRLLVIFEERIIPAVEKVKNWFDKLSSSEKDLIVKTLLFVAALSPALAIMAKVLGIVPALINGLKGISSILSVLSAHPVIAIIGAVAALLTVLYTKNENFRKSVNNLVGTLSKSLEPILKLVSDTLQDIFDILDPIIEMMGNELAQQINMTVELLKPLLKGLEYIFKLQNEIRKGLGYLVGKGWLWGKDSDKTEPSEESYEKYDYGTDIDNYDYRKLTNDYSKTNDYSIDNSQYNINVNLNSTGDMQYDAKALADEVIRQIVVKKQASGR